MQLLIKSLQLNQIKIPKACTLSLTKFIHVRTTKKSQVVSHNRWNVYSLQATKIAQLASYRYRFQRELYHGSVVNIKIKVSCTKRVVHSKQQHLTWIYSITHHFQQNGYQMQMLSQLANRSVSQLASQVKPNGILAIVANISVNDQSRVF